MTTRALAVSVVLLAAALSAGPSAAKVSDPYRYAGVVENGRGAPTHYIGTGDGISLSFFDALSQGRKAERYRVCVGRTRQAPARCWGRRATFGLDRLVFPGVLPRDVPAGRLVARWLVDGRTVATWSFFYVR